MNPEDRALLERVKKLSEENNRILQKMQRAARWALVWGFVKLVIIIAPFVIGYILFEPLFKDLFESYNSVKDLLPL